MSMNLANVLRNPKSPEFQNIYVCLGKRDGKKQYAADCRRLKIQISILGMQTIENGFSRRERVAYSNNCDVNSSLTNWNNDSKRGYSSNKKTIKQENEEKKQLEEKKQKELEEKKRKKLEEKRQQKKEEEEEENFNKWSINNVVVEDSWED